MSAFSGRDLDGEIYALNFRIDYEPLCPDAHCAVKAASQSILYQESELRIGDRSETVALTLEISTDEHVGREETPSTLASTSLDMAHLEMGARGFTRLTQALGGERAAFVRFAKRGENDAALLALSNAEVFELKSFAPPTSIFTYADLNAFVPETEKRMTPQALALSPAPGLNTFLRFETADGAYLELGPIDDDVSKLIQTHQTVRFEALTDMTSGACALD
ncbi:MAG: hypothetical protein AAF719_05270 [Pseudomonadota bacterium]